MTRFLPLATLAAVLASGPAWAETVNVGKPCDETIDCVFPHSAAPVCHTPDGSVVTVWPDGTLCKGEEDDVILHGTVTPSFLHCDDGWLPVTLNGQLICAREFRAPTTK